VETHLEVLPDLQREVDAIDRSHALATAPSDSVARWIAETEAERRGAELRLRRLTKNDSMTADEIRDIVSQMQGLVSILHNACGGRISARGC
jgi:hypothetical protein